MPNNAKSTWSNKTVIITGASSGIGESLAKVFHSRGAKVLLVARRRERLEKLRQEFNTLRADSAECIVADLTLDSDIQHLCAEIQKREINCLVNNAGFGSFGEFDRLELVREQAMVKLNIIAAMALTHALLPQLKQRKSGHLAFVSSIAGFQAIPYMSTYAATKAFDLFFANGLRAELKEYGVGVTAICPGPVDTEFGGVARVSFASGPRVDPYKVAVECVSAIEAKRGVLCPHWSAKAIKFMLTICPTIIIERILSFVMKDIHRKKIV